MNELGLFPENPKEAGKQICSIFLPVNRTHPNLLSTYGSILYGSNLLDFIVDFNF